MVQHANRPRRGDLRMLIDHVDLTVPPGTLSDEFGRDLDRLLADILGWVGENRVVTSPLDGTPRVELVYQLGNEQYVILREAAEHLQIGFEDHIGVLVEPAEFDRIFEQCQTLASSDDRACLGWTVNGRPVAAQLGPITLRGFYVKFLLPIWLDIQTRDPRPA